MIHKMLSLVPDPVIHKKNPLAELARGLSLFGELEADAGAVGALGELGDSLDGGSVAHLALLLQQMRHLRGVEHQTHALLGLCDIALDGLSGRLESDLTVLGVIGISAAKRDAVDFCRELVAIEERERGVVAGDTDVVVIACQRRRHVGNSSRTTGIGKRLLGGKGSTGRIVAPAAQKARLVVVHAT